MESCVKKDYERIRELGFNAVWADYVAAGERAEAARVALSTGLAVLVPEIAPVGKLVMHGAGGGMSEVQGAFPEGATAGLAVVNAWGGAVRPIDVALRMEYARGLAAGHNQGVLVWRYRSWPGEENGIAGDDGRVEARVERAVRSLVGRVRDWGPAIKRAELVPEAPVSVEGSDSLAASCYASRAGPIVIVRNVDAEHVSRGVVSIPAVLAGRSVTRAVERGSGQRFAVQEGGVCIPVRLGPGDAALFEIH